MLQKPYHPNVRPPLSTLSGNLSWKSFPVGTIRPTRAYGNIEPVISTERTCHHLIKRGKTFLSMTLWPSVKYHPLAGS